MDSPTHAAPATLTTRQKALALNLDARAYGTFAEIGGGQEVARWFFAVGGAAGTVAKTISAYDMTVSDGIYGATKRYVSRQRLEAMLAQEFDQLKSQLDKTRGDKKCFFAFADTVATRSYSKAGNGRGWLGLRFQNRPNEEPSEIIIHAEMLDTTAARQQEALGILGVNLIHTAFFRPADPRAGLAALLDELTRERVEIDMIKVSGPAFKVDNRLMTLELVEQNLTDAAMFTAAGEVVQPSEVLYKKPILVERGSFRPATNLTVDLLERAMAQFLEDPKVRECADKPVVLAEMTLRSLTAGPRADHEDFLARAEILGALGYDVLVSRFEPYYQLAEYLAAYTDAPIGMALGMPTMLQVADEKYYQHMAGGVLESAGRLFKRSVKMYVHPALNPETNQITTLENVRVKPPWHHLHELLVELGQMVPIRGYNESFLSIETANVLALIEKNDPAWESMVPPKVAKIIKAKKLFAPRPGMVGMLPRP